MPSTQRLGDPYYVVATESGVVCLKHEGHPVSLPGKSVQIGSIIPRPIGLPGSVDVSCGMPVDGHVLGARVREGIRGRRRADNLTDADCAVRQASRVEAAVVLHADVT